MDYQVFAIFLRNVYDTYFYHFTRDNLPLSSKSSAKQLHLLIEINLK